VAESRFSNLEFDDRSAKAPAAGKEPAGPGRAQKPYGNEPRDAAFYLRQADIHELTGDFEAGLRSFSAALGEDPLLLDAWLGQLRMLVELEEYPEARLWADKAAEKFPDHPQLLAAKSVALHRMGLHHEAREMNARALQAKGESASVWLCRGELMLAGSGPAAAECFARARRLAAPKGPALLAIGALYLRYRQYSLALSTLQEAAAAVPRAARVWYLLGCTQNELGLAKGAAVSFQQARQLAPQIARYRQAANGDGVGIVARVRGLFRRLLNR